MDNPKVRDDTFFRTAMVRYIIDGQRYDVPMGYHWGTYLKYRQWPTPKSTYLETTAFEIFALLPDFLPYLDTTKEKFDKRQGKGDIVEIMVQSKLPRKSTLEIIKESQGSGRFELLPDNPEAPGLTHYIDKKLKHAKESLWEDLYIPKENLGTVFWIECSRKHSFEQSCHVYDWAGGEDMPSLNYTYRIAHLPRWREIRQGVISLVTSFKTKNSGTK